MIFLWINWPSFNLEARTLRSCIHLLHYFNTVVHGRKTGHLASREGLDRNAGQWGQDGDAPGNSGRLATLSELCDVKPLHYYYSSCMWPPPNSGRGSSCDSDWHVDLLGALATMHPRDRLTDDQPINQCAYQSHRCRHSQKTVENLHFFTEFTCTWLQRWVMMTLSKCSVIYPVLANCRAWCGHQVMKQDAELPQR